MSGFGMVNAGSYEPASARASGQMVHDLSGFLTGGK
jgi:hypothetical protein